jgi:pimeloyl-ACP methyl ester carboxylesterase
MKRAGINGQGIAYEDSGGDGPTVLFSHGFLMDRGMFAPQLADLAGEFRCITWDERGWGETDWDGKPFSYWDLAHDALGLLDHLGLGSATFVGMSQGGFLSLRAALTAPDRVRALVLMDSQAGVDDEATRAAYRAMYEEWLANGPHDAITGAVASIILGPDPAVCAPWIAKWKAIPPERLTEPFECLVGRDDITGRLGEIYQPALVIHGTEDTAITMDRAEALCAGLPNCEGIVHVEGAAHAANLTHPALVNPPLAEFLRAPA